jgi:C-terminal peptidase prc
MRTFPYIQTLVCLLALSSSAWADEEGDTDEASVSEVNAIIDVVLDHHIDPPTKQEMVLSGVRALFRAAGKPLPRGVSREISALSTPELIDDYVRDVVAGHPKVKGAKDVLLKGMAECVRGGASFRDASINRVSSQVAANRYVGTGIALSFHGKTKRPMISKVFYNGPAWKAGAKSMDQIVEIDGKSTAKMKMNQVLEALRGEAGTQVAMLVQQPKPVKRPVDEATRQLIVTRGRIFLPTIEGYRLVSEGQWKYSIDADPKVALIRLTQIGPSTLHELRRAETALRDEGVLRVILDLRIGGALLHDVVMVADALIDDAVIGHVRSLDGRTTHTAQPGVMFQDMTMAVLTSRFTSAGHVFLAAAALQDSGRAEVFGERTPGNTYVKSLIDIPDRDEQITIATAVMERADGTQLLVPSNRSAEISIASMERLGMQKKTKRTGFILPNHEVTGKAIRAGGFGANDHLVKVATASIRHRFENGNAAGDSSAE